MKTKEAEGLQAELDRERERGQGVAREANGLREAYERDMKRWEEER